MNTSWDEGQGRLIHRWQAVGYSAEFNLQFIVENPNMQSGYLPATPDFASHSPFGDPVSWFQPNRTPFE